MAMTNPAGEPVHFSFPFRRGDDGKVACDVQGTREHIVTQVNVVLAYPRGYRDEKPDMGIPWPAFEPAPVDASAIQAAVEEQVPDCDVHWTEAAGATPDQRVIELDVETP
jgi:hypothetical protein